MSSCKLWEIPYALDNIVEMLVDPETGEILSDEEAYKLLSEYIDEADRKTEYIAKECKNIAIEIEAIKEQKKIFDQRMKACNNRLNSLKGYIDFALQGEKWKADDGSIAISYRNTKNVVNVTDIEAIDNKYFKTPHTENNLNKTLIKEDILEGKAVAGAELIDKKSVIIK